MLEKITIDPIRRDKDRFQTEDFRPVLEHEPIILSASQLADISKQLGISPSLVCTFQAEAQEVHNSGTKFGSRMVVRSTPILVNADCFADSPTVLPYFIQEQRLTQERALPRLATGMTGREYETVKLIAKVDVMDQALTDQMLVSFLAKHDTLYPADSADELHTHQYANRLLAERLLEQRYTSRIGLVFNGLARLLGVDAPDKYELLRLNKLQGKNK